MVVTGRLLPSTYFSEGVHFNSLENKGGEGLELQSGGEVTLKRGRWERKLYLMFGPLSCLHAQWHIFSIFQVSVFLICKMGERKNNKVERVKGQH